MNDILFTENSILSPDGTTIGYKALGKGPGLLIIHGVFRASQHYLRLAEKLAADFTVYIMDRRGRNRSGPQGEHYSLEKEYDDTLAILRKHNIALVFGHSFGGIVALNIGQKFPLEKIAVYEPGLSIGGSLPLGWLPQFEKEISKRDFVSAMLTLTKGLQMGGPLNGLPKFLLRPLFRNMSRKHPHWKENEKLLALIPQEIKAGKTLESVTAHYRELNMPVLLLAGSKSPRYLHFVLDEIKPLIPNATRKTIEGIGHNAPDEEAPEKIAPVLLEFFRQ